MNTQVPTLEEIRAQFRREDQAARLGWTVAHADAVAWACAGTLHADAKGFYRTGRKGGRGRAVSRDRVRALIRAGFLELDGAAVVATADGREGLAAWETVRPVPAVEDPKEALRPLYQGEEATRRHRAWEARIERHRAEADAFWEAAQARLEAAEEEERRRYRERAARPVRSVWDAINGPRPDYTYEADGTVTLNGVDVTTYDDATEVAPAVERQAVTHTAPRRRTALRRPIRRLAVQRGPARRRPSWPRPASAPAARRLDFAWHGRRHRTALTR
ncbi:hypothetical protein ACWDRB_47260 [Nonomuraea sp. NPDC003707]